MTVEEFGRIYYLALDIAKAAHAGQKDKAGKPYIFHPVQVSNYCTSDEAKIIALLHDVLEDNPEYTVARLVEMGIPRAIAKAVQDLTRIKGERYSGYIFRIQHCKPVVIEVKLADLRHNMEVHRLPDIQMSDVHRLCKYHKYYKQLEEAIK